MGALRGNGTSSLQSGGRGPQRYSRERLVFSHGANRVGHPETGQDFLRSGEAFVEAVLNSSVNLSLSALFIVIKCAADGGKPNSVPPRKRGSDGHFSHPAGAGALPKQGATNTRKRPRLSGAGQTPRVPCFVLHHMGFVLPRRLPDGRWALTPPFHPYPVWENSLRRFLAAGRFFLCDTFRDPTLSSQAPACYTRHVVWRCSDFPLVKSQQVPSPHTLGTLIPKALRNHTRRPQTSDRLPSAALPSR